MELQAKVSILGLRVERLPENGTRTRQRKAEIRGRAGKGREGQERGGQRRGRGVKGNESC